MRTLKIVLFLLSFFQLQADDLDLFGKGLNETKESEVSIKSIWSADSFKKGDQLYLGLKIKLKKGWHIYAPVEYLDDESKNDVIPTNLTVKESSEVNLEASLFPEPKKKFYEVLGKEVLLYDSEFTAFVPVLVPLSYELETIDLTLEFFYQACDDQVCKQPEAVTIKASIKQNLSGVSKKSDDPVFGNIPQKKIQKVVTKNTLPKEDAPFEGVIGFVFAVFLAFAGGFLLNFTPCVLPVIPLKIMSLNHKAASNKRRIYLAFIMAAGIIGFWLLMGVLIAFVQNFTAVNQLFHYSPFLLITGLVILLMSISMFGLFEFRVPQKLSGFQFTFDSALGSLGIGVMTAILSTPCTGPFMGSVSLWSLSKPSYVSLSIFFFIGFGMSLPYFVLSLSPKLVKWLPKGGEGSLALKKVMAIFMFATAIFFLGLGISKVLGLKGKIVDEVIWIAVFLVCIYGGFYIIQQTFKHASKKILIWLLSILGALIMIGSTYGIFSKLKPPSKEMLEYGNWVAYEEEVFTEALSQGRPVMIDFTADWCLNCKALEATVLNSNEALGLYKIKKPLLLKVDLTDGDEASKALLKREGSIVIPYLVIYNKGKVVFNANFYRFSDLQKALE